MKPLIGITTYGRHENKIASDYYQHYYATPSLYIDAVRRAGGLPILLPPDEEYIHELLSRIDGVIVAGGGDIHPDNYNGNATHPNLTRVDTERDAHEIRIIRVMAESKDKPVLCICRGMQVLNVALGGTMTEHIPDIRETDIHRKNGFWTLHEISVEKNTKLAEAIQSTTVTTFSGHHQAVKEIANGLQVVATAPDGIVEGLELIGHPWMVGVQWHPEKSAFSDATQQRLFDTVVELARIGIREASG